MGKAKNPFEPAKKRLSTFNIILITIGSILLVAAAVIVVDIMLTREEGMPPRAFGYSLFFVTTDGMAGSESDSLQTGTAILVQQTNAADLKKGDIITFTEGTSSGGELLVNTHRIVDVSQASGSPVFKTKGDNIEEADKEQVAADNVVGKVVLIMPWLGHFFSFLQTPLGIIVAISIPLAIILLGEIIHLCRLNKKSKQSAEPVYPLIELEKSVSGISDSNISTNNQSKNSENTSIPFERENEVLFRNNIPVDNEKQALNIDKFAELDTIRAMSDIENTELSIAEAGHFTQQGITDTDKGPNNDYNSAGSAGSAQTDFNDELPAIKAFESTMSPYQEAQDSPDDTKTNDPEAFIEEYNAQTQPIFSKQYNNNAEELPGDFVADMETKGDDRFVIDGIDVIVKPEKLNLSFDEVSKSDIAITVTKDYTSVSVEKNGKEINFALFKNEDNDGEKVVIQKRNIEKEPQSEQ